ncbi:MAG: hypothetical protein UX13_C0021G0007 [Candidatus Woesebacteria bacterium GW2011_GWB1_45_5]|uniref:Uncharacterized protein n=1 Tax=Candidatus Woesebacteria bacterium GW2011_GWB1_45_5 TaxID=1618581 RepID=A0A0G1MPP2_9BACT|nr:MAG: hypothetical protein UX13_C0021G0007 [Candidatus Woesebacteria bacterium GW2011_GWB1_45_5]
MLTTPPVELSEVLLLESLGIHVGPLILRLSGIVLLLLNSYLFSRLFKKWPLPFFIFLINPWTVYLHTFFTFQCTFLTGILILTIKNKKLLFLLLTLAVFVYLQKNISENFLFVSKITPANLATEINERQKIDFLATNKTFILPAVVRKITYNKPVLAFDKILKHFVSFFDFEQTASPSESYAITRLSGLSPKGNFPLLFIWEIPLIIFGIAISLKMEGKKWLVLFMISLLPIFVAEKKLFPQTAFLIIPFLLYWETVAIEKLLTVKKIRLVLVVLALFAAFEVFGYHRDFYTRPMKYKNSESYFYRQIADWVAKNRDKNVVVTTLFGPTDKMIGYYLGEIPANVSFQNFDLIKEATGENMYYIGLPGQFVKKGKDLEKKEKDESRTPIIEKINGEDELIFEYGESLWIGYQK